MNAFLFCKALFWAKEAVEELNLLRLMENVHPVVFNGTKPGTRPEGVGTEPSEAKVKKS